MSASLACMDTDVSVSKATEYTVTTLFSISSLSQPKFTKSVWYVVKSDAPFSHWITVLERSHTLTTQRKKSKHILCMILKWTSENSKQNHLVQKITYCRISPSSEIHLQKVSYTFEYRFPHRTHILHQIQESSKILNKVRRDLLEGNHCYSLRVCEKQKPFPLAAQPWGLCADGGTTALGVGQLPFPD